MNREDIEKLDHVLLEAQQIVEESLAQKQTLPGIDLMMAILKLRKKVRKTKEALKRPVKP